MWGINDMFSSYDTGGCVTVSHMFVIVVWKL